MTALGEPPRGLSQGRVARPDILVRRVNIDKPKMTNHTPDTTSIHMALELLTEHGMERVGDAV